MKTRIIRTALAALAVASLGFTACQAGVEAAPKGTSGNTAPAQMPTSSITPDVKVTEIDGKDSKVSASAGSDGVSVGAGDVNVKVGPNGVDVGTSKASVSAGSDGVSVGAGDGTPAAEKSAKSIPGVAARADGITVDIPSTANKATCTGGKGIVDELSAVVRFEGHCDVIEVHGSSNTVYADSVGKLIMDDISGKVAVKKVDSIEADSTSTLIVAGGDVDDVSVSGISNTILVTGAISRVGDTGLSNTVTDRYRQ
jgi:lipoprotein